MNSNIISIFLGLSFIFSSSIYSASLPGSPSKNTMTPLANERFNTKTQQDKSKTTTGGTSLYQSGQGGSSLYQGNQNSSSLYSGARTAPAKTATPTGPVKGTTTK